ncbi:DNA (cytosine-5-)-methyltransferase [Erysipelothrix sp. HDW6C]|uniref:DNA (cytosine-5-)-methyltransferase n=1 Tax=Erysipelothrix sp. HDW6C TaxID=2714930 RepID=UPI00140B4173|nr:DNA (cytosine-5-)-methyltransferase [Erysipelothrix sp. HDW6C]QIK70860.1 DNA (cytosine-5-)-methyltransferase [Erysipelothrix sp. HDW6C]
MINHQMDLFDALYPTFRFKKDIPIRVVELFAGIGFQAMGLDLAEIPYHVVATSEIDKFAIKAYEAIHGHNPNLGSITEIQGNGIPKNIDLLTYSFPCTDLSKAGKQKGLNNTRSGLVYEVLRILAELKDIDNLPKVLIMENVVDLVQSKFIKQFNEIQLELEGLGYTNYTQKLNAKNYGIAQNRDRVFMVSILGEWNYSFPKAIELEHRLKDYLEIEVDEKYYLTDKQLNAIQNPKFESMGIDRVNSADGVVNTITTMGGGNREPKVFEPMIGYPLKGLSRTLKAEQHDAGVVENQLRIRKLTPTETGRLMGMTDEQIERQREVMSNSQMYKQHGNGIVAQVIAMIIGMMYYEDEKELRDKVMSNSHGWLK